jgi:hypothetical protein
VSLHLAPLIIRHGELHDGIEAVEDPREALVGGLNVTVFLLHPYRSQEIALITRRLSKDTYLTHFCQRELADS